jgi:hypothetical protein
MQTATHEATMSELQDKKGALEREIKEEQFWIDKNPHYAHIGVPARDAARAELEAVNAAIAAREPS